MRGEENPRPHKHSERRRKPVYNPTHDSHNPTTHPSIFVSLEFPVERKRGEPERTHGGHPNTPQGTTCLLCTFCLHEPPFQFPPGADIAELGGGYTTRKKAIGS
jgi:hypothetical protein